MQQLESKVIFLLINLSYALLPEVLVSFAPGVSSCLCSTNISFQKHLIHTCSLDTVASN